MKKTSYRIAASLLILILFTGGELSAQTTGKIAGKVLDAETGEPLPGANIQIEGTNMGAATSLEGDYFIINVPPGSYTLIAQYIGYERVKVENLRVSINRTTEQNFRLNASVIEGQEVVVEADKFTLKKDQTSSVRNVSSEQMDILPVESVGQVVNLQAGVVEGHFRGGRFNEVTYLIDGLQVTDSFSSSGRAINVEAEAVEEVEVIKGTFSAKYGRAMIGVVNAVTKSGGKDFHGFVSANLANYLTPNKDIFIGLKDEEFDRRKDYKFQLSGPILGDWLTFFTNVRYQDNKDHLNGIKLFKPYDRSFFNSDDPATWYSEKSGDSSYTAMGWSKTASAQAKVTAKLTNSLKLSLLYLYNDGEGQSYDHNYKYKPEGREKWYDTSKLYALTVNHMLSPRLFYEAKFSLTDNDNGWYLFEDPYQMATDFTDWQSGYIPDWFDSDGTGPGFIFGGQGRGHTLRNIKDYNAKLDVVWQVHKNHSLQIGLDYLGTDLDQQGRSVRNRYAGTQLEYVLYEPTVMPDSTVYADIYHKKPFEFAAYVEDKMEFDEMVINFGVRYDRFDPQTQYPSNRRNPVNLIEFDDQRFMSTLIEAEAKEQVSPRLGLSYQLGRTALLHFSYGHFFQRPPYQRMFQNNSLIVAPQNFSTEQGNPQVKAQKTVQYEIGLWQQLMEGMGLEISLFYRDIYDLLSMAVLRTYNDEIYGLYTNLDYGNAKGLELTYDWAYKNVFANVNYTLQYTRGNANDPLTTFNRAGQNMDPIPRLIPMNWDQRHTLNANLAYTTRTWSFSVTGRYGSGTPYSLSPLPETRLARVLLYPNNSQKPSQYSVDLYTYYYFPMLKGTRLKLELLVYNLLDRLNENGVHGRTGRAYTNIVLDQERANHRSDFNEYEDRFQNPAMYSAPRMVKLGLGIEF